MTSNHCEDVANTRLIAAALEMYELLKEVLEWMTELDKIGVTNDDLFSDIADVMREK